MKNIVVLVVMILVTLSVQSQSMETTSKSIKKINIEDTRLLRHVVLFKFKETASSKDIQVVEKAFANLPNLIKEIHDFEWGTNNSPENLNKEFTHSFIVTFTNENDRDIYLPHPAHQAFVEVLKPHLEDVLVIDYWTN